MPVATTVRSKKSAHTHIFGAKPKYVILTILKPLHAEYLPLLATGRLISFAYRTGFRAFLELFRCEVPKVTVLGDHSKATIGLHDPQLEAQFLIAHRELSRQFEAKRPSRAPPHEIPETLCAFAHRLFQSQFHSIGQRRDHIQQRTLPADASADEDLEVPVKPKVDVPEAAVAATLNRFEHCRGSFVSHRSTPSAGIDPNDVPRPAARPDASPVSSSPTPHK